MPYTFDRKLIANDYGMIVEFHSTPTIPCEMGEFVVLFIRTSILVFVLPNDIRVSFEKLRTDFVCLFV